MLNHCALQFLLYSIKLHSSVNTVNGNTVCVCVCVLFFMRTFYSISCGRYTATGSGYFWMRNTVVNLRTMSRHPQSLQPEVSPVNVSFRCYVAICSIFKDISNMPNIIEL